ncbi:sensor histidine kinase, partial [Siphonobacter sp.]|uniref:sensor histidine kinase n=1 Tax=Siphonobacter sp. TaxID=1869184 RepID=UPI003B3BDDF5
AQEDRVDLLIDGEFRTFYFNFTYKALRDARGATYGIINTATDVTAQVNARQQLEETEQNLRDAIELAELGTWSRNLNTGKISCSSRIQQWYGFTEAETDVEAFMAAVHPEDRHQVLDLISQAVVFRKSDHYSAEYRVVNLQTGEERIVQSQGKVTCDSQGKPYLLSGTSRDVTSQKQASLGLERLVSQRTQELQQANELLQRSNRELEQYAYVASHDLQEPLRKIRMFSGIIREMNDLPERARNPLAKVIHSSERMTLLIRDLLEFSRLLKVDRVLTSTDLNTIVQNVITDFELAIQEKSATVEVGTLPTVNAESLQMNQLFYNLLSNALKFTKEGVPARISITCQRLLPQEAQTYALPEGAYYDIQVRDNGIGFSENYKDQIFEVFKRLHTREVYPGSGIGLALCRKIVQNHGGLLYAESEEGQGSTFHVILPDPSGTFHSSSISF